MFAENQFPRNKLNAPGPNSPIWWNQKVSSTMKATRISYADSTIILTVLNKLQTEQIRETQLRLSQYFADAVKNDEMRLVIEMAEVQDSQASTEFMNDRERYDEMVKKNPKLDELRKRLDLDLLG